MLFRSPHSPPCLSPSLSRVTPEDHCRRRSSPPQPQPLPRPTDALRGAAATYSPSSLSYTSQDGPNTTLAAFFSDHGRRMPPSDSPSPPPPRARRPSLRTHREPLSISPLSPCPSAPSNHPGCRSRPFLAAGDDADGARATVANSRARQHAQYPSRSRARPPVRPAVPPSANPDLPELRRPPRSTPATTPATPAPNACTTRRASPPASRRCPPPAVWSPEMQTRGSPPRLASPASSRRWG